MFFVLHCSLFSRGFHILFLESPVFVSFRQMYGRYINRSLIIERKFIRMELSFVDMIWRILVDFKFYILILLCTNKEVNLVFTLQSLVSKKIQTSKSS